MDVLFNIVLAIIFYLLHRMICYIRAREEGGRQYRNGILHGRAAMYSELAAWVNEHHRDILHELPPQR